MAAWSWRTTRTECGLKDTVSNHGCPGSRSTHHSRCSGWAMPMCGALRIRLKVWSIGWQTSIRLTVSESSARFPTKNSSATISGVRWAPIWTRSRSATCGETTLSDYHAYIIITITIVIIIMIITFFITYYMFNNACFLKYILKIYFIINIIYLHKYVSSIV